MLYHPFMLESAYWLKKPKTKQPGAQCLIIYGKSQVSHYTGNSIKSWKPENPNIFL